MKANILFTILITLSCSCSAQADSSPGDPKSWVIENLEFGTPGAADYYCAQVYKIPSARGSSQYRFRGWCPLATYTMQPVSDHYTLALVIDPLRLKLGKAPGAQEICDEWALRNRPSTGDGAVHSRLTIPALPLDIRRKGRLTDGNAISLSELANPPVVLSPRLVAYGPGGSLSLREDPSLSNALSTALSKVAADQSGYFTFDTTDHMDFVCRVAIGAAKLKVFYSYAWLANPIETPDPEVSIDTFGTLFSDYWSRSLSDSSSVNGGKSILNAISFGLSLAKLSQSRASDGLFNNPKLLLDLFSAVAWNPFGLGRDELQRAGTSDNPIVMNAYRQLETFTPADPRQPNEYDHRGAQGNNAYSALLGQGEIRIIGFDEVQP